MPLYLADIGENMDIFVRFWENFMFGALYNLSYYSSLLIIYASIHDQLWSNGLLSSEGHQTIPKTENIFDGQLAMLDLLCKIFRLSG